MTTRPTGKVTLPAHRTVLAVVRNGASAVRILEVIRLLDNDHRLTVRMTLGPHSRYDHGVEQLLHDERIRLLPWEMATALAFDLILSGSAHACLRELTGPVVLFPHGAGHHKRPPFATDGEQVFELTEEQLLHDGVPIAARHLLPGKDSMDRLVRDCPAAAEQAVVAGDPLAQQLRSNAILREAYRADLGLRPEQRLIVVSSTWGPGSLAARALGLVTRLVAELPIDEYRVAAIFHHNVTIHDGHRELERILRAAIDSGLILVPPHVAWQSTVVASDALIGDHGSTTFYAADVVPVAMAAHDRQECPADSPMTALIDTVPHINPDGPLRPQIDALLTGPRPDVTTIVGSSIEHRVDAAAAYRSTMYELMNLDEPATPAFLAVDRPPAPVSTPTAFLVDATVDGTEITVARYPAATAAGHPGRYLVVRTDDLDPRRAQTATALVATSAKPDLTALLHRFPGARIAVKPTDSGAIAIQSHDGTRLVATATQPDDPDLAALVAAVLPALIDTGRPIEHIPVTIVCGSARIAVRFALSA